MDGGVVEKLAGTLGPDGFRVDEAALDAYGRDATEDLHFTPAAVALPVSREEVAAVVGIAAAARIPITPRGAGTGLSGGALPVCGGLVLSLERMNEIRDLDEANLTVVAEAGVVNGDLQRFAEERGLFYPPDPASRETCCLGGNIGEDAAGPRSCKYGTTRRYVLGLEGVFADGTPFSTGAATRKNAAGYNLTQLLVGSEGTLAVITAATLRLLAQPRARLSLALPFARLEAAAAAVAGIFHAGHEPAACEILDRAALKTVSAVESVPAELAESEAALVLEMDGAEGDLLVERAAALGETAEALGSGEPLVAIDASDQRRLWRVREGVGEALRHRSPFKEADTVVPRSRLAEMIVAAHEIAAANGLEAACFGHAGDGNLHVCMLRLDWSEDEWVRRRDAAEAAIFERAVGLGGSVTGEHGIGWTQRAFLPLAEEPPALDAMLRIKKAMDPHGILNPEKIFCGGGSASL